MFIGPGILIYIFKAFKLEYEWHTHLFPYLLYPCSEIALCSSIYMTVAIAVERFIGLCRPFRRLSTRPCPAKAYIFPVLIFSIGKTLTLLFQINIPVRITEFWEKTLTKVLWLFLISENDFDWLTKCLVLLCTEGQESSQSSKIIFTDQK